MDKKVIIYTQDTCGPCHAEKEWLKAHNIDFEERNIRKNSAYMNEAVELGASATPVTVIETSSSRETVMGFKQDKLSSLLGI